jgi:ribosomal-protein-alanine N-acetyltransferase
MQFRTLTHDDRHRLLAFEIENRDWFEQFIPPRPEDIYTEAGIAAHIEECLDGYAKGTFHPCVMLDPDGNIIGRANLREMDLAACTAEIGYRVAKRHAGRGVASAAVTQLKSVAQSQWKLARLTALVTVINPASRRVLEKSGFVRTDAILDKIVIRGTAYDRHQYTFDLA